MQSDEDEVSLSDIDMGCGAGKCCGEGRRKRIVVFGATGRQGGSVLKALTKDRTFLAIGVARNVNSSRAIELREEGYVIEEGDLEDPEKIRALLKGAYGCYIVTSYWEHFDITRDSQQGKNAVDCAIACGVQHIIFSGQESPKAVIDRCCDPFDSKRRVEEYLKKKKAEINYTVIRLPFYFDNLLSMIKPHRLRNGNFAIAYPMDDVPLHGIALEDIGKCVLRIFHKPEVFRRKTLPLSGDQLTVQEYADVLSRRLAPKVFCDPQVQPEALDGDYRPGSSHMAVHAYHDSVCFSMDADTGTWPRGDTSEDGLRDYLQSHGCDVDSSSKLNVSGGSRISLEDYGKFSFKGSKELSTMFAFYKMGRPFRDIRATRKLYKGTMSFDDWVIKNKAALDGITI